MSAVFERYRDLDYPRVVRGEGVRLYLDDGREILDACSGGAMVACLGHGLESVIARAAEQAERFSYVYSHDFTNDPQERLAERFLTTAAPELARVRFTSGGSEANEMALRLVRQYHVDRGEVERWRVILPAQAYHGSTLGHSHCRAGRRCSIRSATTSRTTFTSRPAISMRSTASSRRPGRRRSPPSSVSPSARPYLELY